MLKLGGKLFALLYFFVVKQQVSKVDINFVQN